MAKIVTGYQITRYRFQEAGSRLHGSGYREYAV
jgi:hypothetical protein